MSVQFWIEVKAPCCSEMLLSSVEAFAYTCTRHGTLMSLQTAIFYGWASLTYRSKPVLDVPRVESLPSVPEPVVIVDMPTAVVVKKPSWLQTLLDALF